MNERIYSAPSGIPALIALIVLLLGDAAWFINAVQNRVVWAIIVAALLFVALLIGLGGFFTVAPNEGKVLQFFGRYVGTVRDAGPRWTNPFYSKRGVSLRVRNFESSKLKVNDLDGNPIEIASVVVWQVVDTAEALFQVNDYEDFVHIQSESALRQMAQSYPYDSHDSGGVSLRSHGKEISDHLQAGIQERSGQRRREGGRSAHHASGFCAGNRPGDVAAPAGQRDHRRAHAHRRRRGDDGRDGARTARGTQCRQSR